MLKVYNCQLFQLPIRAGCKCSEIGDSYGILQLSSISGSQMLKVYNCQLFQRPVRAGCKCSEIDDSHGTLQLSYQELPRVAWSEWELPATARSCRELPEATRCQEVQRVARIYQELRGINQEDRIASDLLVSYKC